MTKSMPVLVNKRHKPLNVPDVAPYAIASHSRVRSAAARISSTAAGVEDCPRFLPSSSSLLASSALIVDAGWLGGGGGSLSARGRMGPTRSEKRVRFEECRSGSRSPPLDSAPVIVVSEGF